MFSMEQSRPPRGRPNRQPRTSITDPRALTRRERVVLAEMARGLENAEIAERLCLSRSTLKHHVSHILQKLGVANRTQAVLAAINRGWTDPDAEWTTPTGEPESGHESRVFAKQLRLPRLEGESPDT